MTTTSPAEAHAPGLGTFLPAAPSPAQPDAELMPMPIRVIAERGGAPRGSKALDKMRQISHGIVASREGIIGVVLVSLLDSQPVVVASDPEYLYLNQLLDVCRSSAAMFRGASLKAEAHAAEIAGRRGSGPVVRSIQVESDSTVAFTRLLDERSDHMLMLITLKSQPIGVGLMTVKQACQELDPLLAQHLAAAEEAPRAE